MRLGWWAAVGVAVAVPVGVRYRTYAPLVYLGLGGTLVDLLDGASVCQALSPFSKHVSEARAQGALTAHCVYGGSEGAWVDQVTASAYPIRGLLKSIKLQRRVRALKPEGREGRSMPNNSTNNPWTL